MPNQYTSHGGTRHGNQASHGGAGARGFASMDESKQREIASKGGSSVPAEKRSFSRDHELAAEAGRKGGENSHGGHSRRDEY